MLRSLKIFAACCALTACSSQRETAFLVPDVPRDLREPVPEPTGPLRTTGDLATRAVELRAALGTANGRIGAIDCILDAAERGVGPACEGRR
ncbi:Rz1-like lysis system protein LysC [Citreimonas sp.]|uniref:Rz1-like lysis system protein LysC n=1 Tax=Citreimonas sp. TaxID=3036715 RepID=UPI0040593285